MVLYSKLNLKLLNKTSTKFLKKKHFLNIKTNQKQHKKYSDGHLATLI